MPQFITNEGLAILASRLKGDGAEPVYLAWGTGAAVASPSSTEVSGEVGTRAAMISQLETVTQVNDAYKLTGSISSQAIQTITNWGVFDALSGGNLLLHSSMVPGVDVVIGQIGIFTFRIQFMRGDE